MPNFDKKRPSYGISKTQCTSGINQSTCRPGPVDPTVLSLQITVCFLARDFLPHASSNLSPCMLQPSNSCAPATNDEGVACQTTTVIIMKASRKAHPICYNTPISEGNIYASVHKQNLDSSSLLPLHIHPLLCSKQFLSSETCLVFIQTLSLAFSFLV